MGNQSSTPPTIEEPAIQLSWLKEPVILAKEQYLNYLLYQNSPCQSVLNNYETIQKQLQEAKENKEMLQEQSNVYWNQLKQCILNNAELFTNRNRELQKHLKKD